MREGKETRRVGWDRIEEDRKGVLTRRKRGDPWCRSVFQRCYHRGGGLYHHRNVSDEKVPGTNQTLTIVSRILLRADDPLAPIVSTELQFARCGWLGLLLPAGKGSFTSVTWQWDPYRTVCFFFSLSFRSVAAARCETHLYTEMHVDVSYIHLKPYRTRIPRRNQSFRNFVKFPSDRNR